MEFHPLRTSVFDERDHSRAQSNSSQELLELPLALRSDESALQQNGAQLIDQSRPLDDQTVLRSVKRLHVKLIKLANELASAERGVVVFTSSTGRQFSLERPEWSNGAFTKALVESFRGAQVAYPVVPGASICSGWVG